MNLRWMDENPYTFKGFSLGDQVKIEGQIVYGQDFNIHNGSFPNTIFKITKIQGNSLFLSGPGYGARPYGNGAIFVWGEALKKVEIITPKGGENGTSKQESNSGS